MKIKKDLINNKYNFKHGETKTKLHQVWGSMKQRILNPNCESYKNYGGRGIIICPEWVNEYTVFRDWSLNNGYANNLEINRINNDGNYEPSNCNWITKRENNRNKRNKINNKLNQKKANEIRELHATGNYTQKELAIKYIVTHQLVSFIINNKSWKI